MSRPKIPAELKRRVLCEAGHRCAIHTCRQTILFCVIAMPALAELTDADLDKIRLIVREDNQGRSHSI